MCEYYFYLCFLVQYVDEAKPLVSKRQLKQKKEEVSQGDVFAASKPSTQHENPDYKKGEGDSSGGGSSAGGSSSGGGGGGGVRGKGDVVTSASKPEEAPPLPPRPHETSDQVSINSSLPLYFVFLTDVHDTLQFRDRAATDPWPTRPTNFGSEEGGAPSESENVAGNQPSPPKQQQQHYMKQISTPEMSHPSSASSSALSGHTHPIHSMSNPYTASPNDDFRHNSQFSAAIRQISEYGDFQTELSVGTDHILKEQSERYAHFESEAMKKKGPAREWLSVNSVCYM